MPLSFFVAVKRSELTHCFGPEMARCRAAPHDLIFDAFIRQPLFGSSAFVFDKPRPFQNVVPGLSVLECHTDSLYAIGSRWGAKE